MSVNIRRQGGVGESVKRVEAFKRKSVELKRRPASPSPEKISRLSTQLWEFSEQVRLQKLLVTSAGSGQ